MADTKVCTKCGISKPVEEFGYKSQIIGKRHSVCKECTAKRSSDWYYQNKKHHIQNVAGRRNEVRRIAHEYVWDYLLRHPCVDCGERDPTVLEFDHVRGKYASLAKLISDGASLDRIQEEIDRCEVRCANCHRRKTSNERGWFRR